MTLRARPPQECPCVAGCGKLWRARSRLYQSQILQENMRLKALAEIYTIHFFAELCNLNFCFLPKMLQQEKKETFCKISSFF